jgi:hypothetical protein
VINACWPTQRPIQLVDRMLPGTAGRRRRWTAADQFLVDEANTLLNGTPFKYGHVVVDEAQDHSAVALRVIGRRATGGSITMVGDVAQSTTPAGQERWKDVFAHLGADGSVADLTIGYRVPQAGFIELVVHDVTGRRVRSLVHGFVTAGQHEVTWDGRDDRGVHVASGVYMYRIRCGDRAETKKMVLLK